MESAHRVNSQMRPPPPKSLSAEELGVWSGWNAMKDREVVREAAVKGSHIELAITFLSVRKQRDHNEMKNWFMDEVNVWINELVGRQQVFRASHVLKNVKLDPISFLEKLFSDTTDSDLRTYIGNHLIKTNNLDDNLLNCWHLLKQIESDDSIILSRGFFDDNFQYSVFTIVRQSAEWKTSVATELFFTSFDVSLVTFLNPDYTWTYLMQNQMLDIIKIWINVYFTQNVECDVSRHLIKITIDLDKLIPIKNIFLNWSITESMIENQSDVNVFNEIVLNELSFYGIFTANERNDIPAIVTRFSHTQNIENVEKILNLQSSTLSCDDFYKLLMQHCIEHNYFYTLSACTANRAIPHDLLTILNSRHLNLWKDIKDTSDDFNNSDVLRENVLKVAQFLANGSLHDYFVANPLILLSILVFTKDLDIFKLFASPVQLSYNDTVIEPETIKDVLKKLPFVRNVLNKTNNTCTKTKVTLYDLLKKHTQIYVNKVFAFRSDNKRIPHFNDRLLIDNYGYEEKLDYSFYLNRSRPGFASIEFERMQLQQYGVIDDIDKFEAKTKAHELALDKFYDPEVTSSCVAFIEMIGEESDLLRIHITTANILHKNNACDNHEIKTMFDNIYENLPLIFSKLENAVTNIHLSLTPNSTAEEIVNALKHYAVVVNFAKNHNLQLPEKFLIHCAQCNMWLPFLMFVQFFNYPISQTLYLVQYFKSTFLVQHFHHAILNDIKPDEQKCLLRDRDSRNYLLSKIGLHKSKDDLMMTSGNQSGSSLSSANSGNSSDLFEFDGAGFNTNLLQVLIRCHNSVDPPKALLHAGQLYKNSLLPILATCYEPDSVITNWLFWLTISSDIKIDLLNIENNVVSSTFVTETLVSVLKLGQARVLSEGFKIFLPDNPLSHLVEFLYQCVHYYDFKTSVNHLDIFKSNLQQINYNPVVPEVDYEMTFLNNKYWLETTAMQLICTALGFCFNSRFHQIQFLQSLCTADFSAYFVSGIPDFRQVLELLNCLPKTDTNLTLSIIFDPARRRNEILRCVKFLTAEKLYSSALKLALLEGVGKDHVLIEEWNEIFVKRDDKFCENSNIMFVTYNVFPMAVVEFYERCYKVVEDVVEKYEIAKTAYKWIQKYKLTSFDHIEKDMWTMYFTLENVELNISDFESNASLILSELEQNLNIDSANCTVLDASKSHCLEETINKLLDCGNILQALRLEKIFQYSDTNLEVLKTCLSLVEGTLLPYQLNTDQRLMLSSPGLSNLKLSYRRRTFLSPKVGTKSLTSISNSPNPSISENLDTSMHDTLDIVDTLSRRLKHGYQIGQKVLMYYRIAVNTDNQYKSIVKCVDPMNMIKCALEENCKNKLEVVHDCIFVYGWNKKMIADFLCEEIINALNKFLKTDATTATLWDLNLDSDFHLILQLLPEQCTLLGLKLFTYANALYKLNIRMPTEENDPQRITFITELFVRAHDCFTVDCNMEGITSVLRKAQKLVMVLLARRSWQLMVRLLTGVGRYTEMNYVFEILKEHDQFEHLLRKGHRKDNSLKVALLEFLKNRCPENRELYRNVALYFTLFSEVAELWEIEAQSIIRKLIAISKLEMQNNGLIVDSQPYVAFTNTDGTKICLNRAMVNYTHAAEYHLQGERLASAMKAAKQAELLALQLSLLKDLPSSGSVPCLLDLTESQLTMIISNDLSFQQTLLLVQTYNFQPDWATVLYEQYVLRGQSQYLDDFLSAYPLNDSIVHDISRKFLSTNVFNPTAVKAMKNILIKIPSVHTMYRLASELGFTDIVESLLAGSQLSYLKDTVWKKGYKQK